MMDENQGQRPDKILDAFDSELAIRREAAAKERQKLRLWAIGIGLACGYLASLLPRMLLDPVARPLLFAGEEWSVPVLLAAIGFVVLIGALGLFLRDRSWTEMRDLSLAGIAILLVRVLFG